jgi:hypothetical protein
MPPLSLFLLSPTLSLPSLGSQELRLLSFVEPVVSPSLLPPPLCDDPGPSGPCAVPLPGGGLTPDGALESHLEGGE